MKIQRPVMCRKFRIEFKGTEKGLLHIEETLGKYASNAYNANFGNLLLDTTNLQRSKFNIDPPACTADKEGKFPLDGDRLELSQKEICRLDALNQARYTFSK